MAIRSLIENYIQFDKWANLTYIDWLASLDPALLQQTYPSSFPSLDLTVQHIVRTQKFWTAFITEASLNGFVWKVIEQSPQVTLDDWQEATVKFHTVMSQFEETDLLKTLHLEMPWAKNNRARYDYILHVVNHSTYHRGQLVTIARGLGVDQGIPASDYNIFNCLHGTSEIRK